MGTIGFGLAWLAGCSFAPEPPVTAEVVGRRWQRDVILEDFEVAIAESWRFNVPRRGSRLPVGGQGAQPGNDGILGCRQKQRSKDDPVPSEWCRYRTRRWVEARRVTAEGEGEPRDPEALGPIGNQRVRRSDRFEVELHWARGSQIGLHLIQTRDPDEYARWQLDAPVAIVLDEADRVVEAQPAIPGRDRAR